MLFLASLFTLWTLWFWILLVLFTAVIIAFDEFDHAGKAATTMLLFLLGVAWFNPMVSTYVIHNPLYILLGVIVYIAIGVVWMFTRWSLFLVDVNAARREQEAKNEEERIADAAREERTRRSTRARPVTAFDDRGEVRDQTNEPAPEPVKRPITVLTVRGRQVPFPVRVRNHKARIIGWSTYWPWSGLWTLLDLLFHRVFHHLYTVFAGKLQAMADRMTGHTEG